MTTDRFERAFSYLLENEGGFVDDPDDPGAATKWGITAATLSAWRDIECSSDDVWDLTLIEARAIYLDWYWERLGCDRLPEGVDVALFDTGVLYGTVIASKLAQETLNALGCTLRVDGVLGPVSGAAIASSDPSAFLTLFVDNILSRIDALVEKKARLQKYKLGWQNRARKLLTLVPLHLVPQT